MENFLLCSIEQKIITGKTTKIVTVYILNTVKRKGEKNQQRQFLIFDEEYKLLGILEQKVSKHRHLTKRNHEPKISFIKNALINLRDILIGSISGALGTILTPKLQDLYHYFEYYFSKL